MRSYIFNIFIIFTLVLLSGCASFFTARPPVIEDKVGTFGKQMVGTLATSPDYRVVYVKLNDDAKLCAEAPADAGGQFAQTLAAALTAEASKAPISAEVKSGIAVAIKQLFIRSQGVQFYRDASFTLCNLYLNANGKISEHEYLAELKEIREIAKVLILKEIPDLAKQTIDPIPVPVAPTPPELSSSPSPQKK